MTNLLVLDKDWTLVRPKSGNTFVQHPEDQELIEGVSEAIARYVADGWQVAIASNQGGCEARWCHPSEVPIGSYCRVGDEGVKCEYLEDTGEYILLNGQHPLPKTVFATYRFKTVSMAIAEMQYAMRLVGLERDTLFCPDMRGEQCWHVHSTVTDEVRHVAHPLHTNKNCEQFVGLFRKPNGGMLLHLKAHYSTTWSENSFLMIGDRSEDEQAAQAAGFDFLWADEWRKSN